MHYHWCSGNCAPQVSVVIAAQKFQNSSIAYTLAALPQGHCQSFPGEGLF